MSELPPISRSEARRLAAQRGEPTPDFSQSVAQHTPGPWRVDHDGASGPIIITSDRENQMLVIGKLEGGRGHPYENDEADSRLIAAAPDLYAACQAALGLGAIPSTQPEYQMLVNAIAKARGS